jgi:hypothetical protein
MFLWGFEEHYVWFIGDPVHKTKFFQNYVWFIGDPVATVLHGNCTAWQLYCIIKLNKTRVEVSKMVLYYETQISQTGANFTNGSKFHHVTKYDTVHLLASVADDMSAVQEAIAVQEATQQAGSTPANTLGVDIANAG